MNHSEQHLEDIRIIKKMMEESSRFLSLSGLSGIFAGLAAVAGAVMAKVIIPSAMITGEGYGESIMASSDGRRVLLLLFADAAVVLFLALASAVAFSLRKAKREGHNIWTPVTRRMLLNLFIPLVTGGFFILFTLGKVSGNITGASMLLFYGLAIVNAAKFTLGEIFWLGILEIITGLVCILFPGYTLAFWVFGFGILHIAYGLFMQLKYK